MEQENNKVDKRIKIKKERINETVETFITTDGRKFKDRDKAEYHQKEDDRKRGRKKKYKNFLKNFNVERKKCDREVASLLLEGDSIDNGGYYDIHKEKSYQWFNIKNEEDIEQINKYYKLFFLDKFDFTEKAKGWYLFCSYSYCGGDYYGSIWYSLKEYKEIIKKLKMNLPC